MKTICKYISYNEATFSPTALRNKIVNEPNATQLVSMQLVGIRCFDPLREWYGKPIKVNSFFRNEALNKAVGGAKNSQHSKGQAIDLTGGSKEENKKLFDWCKENLDFDQLLNEYDYSWVHISYVSREANRKQILTIK